MGPNFLNLKLISENTICIVRASYPEACIWTFWQGCRADLPCERELEKCDSPEVYSRWVQEPADPKTPDAAIGQLPQSLTRPLK